MSPDQQILLHGPGEVRLSQTQEQAEQQRLVEIKACGICSTDRKAIAAPPGSMPLPRVPGHEFCGRRCSDGKPVVVWPAIHCGQCHFCRSGKLNLCEKLLLCGLHLDGGMQHCFSLPSALAEQVILLDMPANLDWQQASLAEPLGCLIHCLARLRQPPASLLIFGAGLLGVLAVRLVNHWWPNCQLEVIDISAERQAPFVSLQGPPQAEVVLLACSAVEAVEQGLERLQPGGTMLLFSGLDRAENPIAMDYNLLHRHEMELLGSYGCLPTDMVQALELIATHKVRVADLLTPVHGLPQALSILGSHSTVSTYKHVIINS